MPSVSRKQQRLMGQALAYKRGEIKSKDLNPQYADEIKKLAKSMTEKQLKDFASTKHKNLPEKVKESNVMTFDSFNKNEIYAYGSDEQAKSADIFKKLGIDNFTVGNDHLGNDNVFLFTHKGYKFEIYTIPSDAYHVNYGKIGDDNEWIENFNTMDLEKSLREILDNVNEAHKQINHKDQKLSKDMKKQSHVSSKKPSNNKLSSEDHLAEKPKKGQYREPSNKKLSSEEFLAKDQKLTQIKEFKRFLNESSNEQEEVLKWWNSLDITLQTHLANEYSANFDIIETIPYDEILNIYRNEMSAKFNESINYDDVVKVRVKDLIEYLQSFDPEMEVTLDKDGWDYHETPSETIRVSNIFDVWDFDGEEHMTINN